MSTTLLLFDIDGTLLTSGGCGERSLRLAVKDYFGVDDDLHDVEIAGRTDTRIARQLLRKYNRPESEALEFLEYYLKHLPLQLPQAAGGRLLPGVTELLAALQGRDNVTLALLTGNLVRGAEHKLGHYGIWHHFKFGAFADDHYDRNELGPVAMTRALDRGLKVTADKTYVLGDTPHDIACARAFGAKAIAVATGGSTYEQLTEHTPDALFADFSDTASVLRAMSL